MATEGNEALSLTDELVNAFAEYEDESEVEDAAGGEEGGENEEGGQALQPDDAGGGEEGDQVEEDEATEDLDGDGEEETVEALAAPDHWASGDKEIFGNVPREAQEFLLKRHHAMEADYTRKTQEIAEIRRVSETIDREMQPLSQDLAMAGADNVAFIRQQVAWAQAFKSDPNAALASLARLYGIEGPQQQEQDDVDPAVVQLRAQVETMEQRETRRLEAQQQAEQQRYVSMIEDFAGEKDDGGALKHPHFQDVQADMGKLINAGLASGLDDAYPLAVSMKGLQQQAGQQAAPAKLSGKPSHRAKVAKAKKAAAGVRSSGAPAKVVAEPISLYDDLSNQWDKQLS